MGLLGTILTVGGTALGAAVGGPAGAKIGAAVGGAVGGAVDGSKANKKASKEAQAAEQRAREAHQYAVGQVRTLQAPYQALGAIGVNNLTSRFGGLTPASGGSAPAGPDYAAYGQAYEDLPAAWQSMDPRTKQEQFGGDPNAFYAYHFQTYGQNEGRKVPTPAPAANDPAAPTQNALTKRGIFGGTQDPVAPAAYVAPQRYQAAPPPAAYQRRAPPPPYVNNLRR